MVLLHLKLSPPLGFLLCVCCRIPSFAIAFPMSSRAMISARGAMPTNTILSEVAATRARVTGAHPLPLHHLDAVWTAMCRVLRAQLLMSNPTAVSPKTCTFFVTHKTVATNGRTKYCLRIPAVSFHPQFATTYGLESGVPRDPTGLEGRRLPFELVSAEARLPADVVSECLREIFLFVGECLFQGRSILLEFAGVGTLLIKRDRVSMQFAQGFLDELFAIDTRKWPAAAREAAEASRAARNIERSPSQQRSSRPRSASSGRPPSASITEKRPDAVPPRAFVSTASTGRTFTEIEAERTRIRTAPKNTARKPTRAPLPVPKPQLHCDPTPLIVRAGEGEEESIYSIMTPHRERDVAEDAKLLKADVSPDSAYDAAGGVISAVPSEVGEAAAPVAPNEPPLQSKPQEALNIFAALSDQPYHEPLRGRKRHPVPHEGLGVADLLTWVPERAAPLRPATARTSVHR